MSIRLNDAAIALASRQVAETGGRREIVDAGCEGLRLRITARGTKTWVLACRDRSGAMRRFPLGAFPAIGVSDARGAARTMRVEVGKGVDPIAERRRDRATGSAAKAGVGTLAAILDQYDAKIGMRLKSWPESRKRLALVFKPLLQKPISALKAADFQMQADDYAFASSASFAVRTLRPALHWAAQRGYMAADIAAAIRQPESTRRRERVLTPDELKSLLPVLKVSKRPYAAAMTFMLLTLARREEVANARWASLDLVTAIWTIPAANSKNKRSHRVPLSRQALELLGSVGHREPDDFIFRSTTNGALGTWDRETKALQAASGTSGWTRHDLRRTGATLLGDLGMDPHVIESALNHATIHSALAATYNRSRYEPEVRWALQTLADRLDGILKGGAEIVRLVPRAG